MMAAYRLRGLGWFAGCAAMVLGFYLVSLRVAHERNRLEGLNRQIRTAERDIRALETEFDTRANLQQLERWNGDILALSAPTAGQFVRNEAQLAAVRFDGGSVPSGPGGIGAEVRTAALVVPSLPDTAPMPTMQPALAVEMRPAPAQAVAVTRVAARAPVTPPAVATVKVAAVKVAPVKVASAPTPRQAPVRVQRVAMLDGALLSDLSASARAEARRR